MKSKENHQQTKQDDKVRLNQPTDYRSQKDTEAEIKRLKYLLATSPTITYTCEAFGSFDATFITENLTEILGYLPSEFLDTPNFWIDHIHPDDKEHVFNGFSTLFENGSHDHEYRFKHKDGHYVWMHDKDKIIYDADANPIEIIGSWKEITARKLAEEELISINEKYGHMLNLMHLVISHARSAIAVHDRDLNYVYVSDRYLEEYGIKEKNVIGKHHYEIFPDLPQKWRDVHQRCLKGEVLSAEEDPYNKEDGSIDWTRWECRPWYESDGTVGGIIVYTEVITQRKMAEEALRTSEKELQTLLHSIQFGVVVHGPDTKIIQCNRTSQELLGLTEEQMLGKEVIDPAWKFCNEDGSNMPLEEYPINQVLTNKNVLSNFIAGVNKPDTSDLIWLLINAVPEIGSDGNIIRVIVTFIDISERRQTEEEREKLIEELQKALAEIKTLRGILPICSFCKNIRNDEGYYEQIEGYIHKHSGVDFSHTICPTCLKKHYPEYSKD